jgi:hypothetical protein
MELHERMTITVKGQLTWANPDLNAKCDACTHFKVEEKIKPLGRCALVKAHTKKKGVPFNGEIATACSKFDR